MGHFTAAAIALLFVAGTAVVSSASDFSRTSCDNPQFEAFMHARLGQGKSDATGKLMPSRFNYGPIISATTIANSGNRISCEITVKLDTPKGTKSIRGIFTASLATVGQNHWRWSPGY